MTSLPNPFVSNSAEVVMLSADTAAAATPYCPPAAAVPIADAVARDMWATLDAYPVPFDEYERDQRLRALYDVLDPPQPPLFLRRPSITDYRPDPSLKHILKVFFAMDA